MRFSLDVLFIWLKQSTHLRRSQRQIGFYRFSLFIPFDFWLIQKLIFILYFKLRALDFGIFFWLHYIVHLIYWEIFTKSLLAVETEIMIEWQRIHSAWRNELGHCFNDEPEFLWLLHRWLVHSCVTIEGIFTFESFGTYAHKSTTKKDGLLIIGKKWIVCHWLSVPLVWEQWRRKNTPSSSIKP